MARNKNALRQHLVQEYKKGEEPGEKWLELAEWITDINDETEEETDDIALTNSAV